MSQEAKNDEKQVLKAVLQFLKKNNLKVSFKGILDD